MSGSSLPARVSEEALREAVRASRSWKEVMRALQERSSALPRRLQAACDELGIDYSHFRWLPAQDQGIATAVQTSRYWPEVLRKLGYVEDSGSARARVRRHCARLGVDTSHLCFPVPEDTDLEARLRPSAEYLRNAGPYLVAAALTLAGHAVTFAAEGCVYDLVVDFDGEGLRRVQVKTGTHWQRKSWACHLVRSAYDKHGWGGHRRGFYSREDIDYFACVDGDARVYLIPIALVEGQGWVNLRKYARFRVPEPRLSVRSRDASDPGPDRADE